MIGFAMPGKRKPLVAGNWKMNGLSADLPEIAIIRDAVRAGEAGRAEVIVCPPITLLIAAAQLCAGSPLELGAQDVHPAQDGAHTGDISAAMLKDAGASYVIVGHSERRTDHGESDALVRAKAEAAFKAGLRVILCVGETHAQRSAGEALPVVAAQLEGSVPPAIATERLVIAYEPVWAIGTGVTPTAKDVAEMHAFIRRRLSVNLSAAAEAVRILYGGSVKPANAAELLAVDNVDGALVGGASLNAREFLAIAGFYR